MLLVLLPGFPGGSPARRGQGRPGFIQQPQDRHLAVNGGDNADPDIYQAAFGFHGELAVLRAVVVGNIHIARILILEMSGVERGQRQGEHIMQRAIDTVAHFQFIFTGLEVNIGRPGFHRFIDNEGQEPGLPGLPYPYRRISCLLAFATHR